jgi:hypothetical protein
MSIPTFQERSKALLFNSIDIANQAFTKTQQTLDNCPLNSTVQSITNFVNRHSNLFYFGTHFINFSLCPNIFASGAILGIISHSLGSQINLPSFQAELFQTSTEKSWAFTTLTLAHYILKSNLLAFTSGFLTTNSLCNESDIGKGISSSVNRVYNRIHFLLSS